MKVGAVVLHYRFWPEARSTLDSLLSQTQPPSQVIVVDNRSGDGSPDRMRQVFPMVEVIEASANRGYGAGMNLGMARMLELGVDAVLLLTHECLLAPDALEALVRRLEEEPNAAAVGPLLAYRSEPRVVYSAGGEIEPRGWRTRHLDQPRLVSDWVGRLPRAAEWLDGAAILLRSDAVREAGMFDEDYFLYFEETEYLLNLRRLGRSVECVPAAVAWQEPGKRPTYLLLRNRLRFLARTAPKPQLFRDVTRLAASVIKNSLIPNRKATRAQLRERRRALIDFLARKWGPDRATTEAASQAELVANRAEVGE